MQINSKAKFLTNILFILMRMQQKTNHSSKPVSRKFWYFFDNNWRFLYYIEYFPTFWFAWCRRRAWSLLTVIQSLKNRKKTSEKKWNFGSILWTRALSCFSLHYGEVCVNPPWNGKTAKGPKFSASRLQEKKKGRKQLIRGSGPSGSGVLWFAVTFEWTTSLPDSK